VTRSKRHLKVAAQDFIKHLRQAGKAFKLRTTNFDVNAEQCGGK
jgi:NAD-dependent SIR2 family protein deacetylase